LKFLTVVALLGGGGAALYTTRDSEVVQRVLGHREDHRLDHAALTPRFEFASARVRITIGSYFNNAGTPVDLTTVRTVTIDRRSSSASADVQIERTATQVEPGVSAIPFDAINAHYTEIMTKDDVYESPTDTGAPWTRSTNPPYYYNTEIDPHYIPMIDDVMGFELRDQHASTPAAPAAGSLRSSLVGAARPQVGDGTPPSAVTKSLTYGLTLESFRRAVPMLAGRADLQGAPETPVQLTLGFDDVGLLRFADVRLVADISSTLAIEMGDRANVAYHYTMSVDEISGDPVKIDVPTNVVDA
jgi:hypothetical protein